MEHKAWPEIPRVYYENRSVLPQRGPLGPSAFRRPFHDKDDKQGKTLNKRAAVSSAFIVLGFDDKQKPRGARFEGANPDLVAKAAHAMDLRATRPNRRNSPKRQKSYSRPAVRQWQRLCAERSAELVSQMLAALAGEPGAALGDEAETPPVASGLPKSWDDIAPGHLVIAQESLENGSWECLVLGRDGDMLTLRFRDFFQATQALAPSRCGRVGEPSLDSGTDLVLFCDMSRRPEPMRSGSYDSGRLT